MRYVAWIPFFKGGGGDLMLFYFFGLQITISSHIYYMIYQPCPLFIPPSLPPSYCRCVKAADTAVTAGAAVLATTVAEAAAVREWPPVTCTQASLCPPRLQCQTYYITLEK
jgi:hypothetical protein